MRIEELMSREVQYCRPDETLDRAASLMWDRDCGCVPVCSGDGAPRVVGMITDRDICMAALFQGRPLSELKVSEAMSADVRTCRPADRPAAVESVMRDQQIRRVPVVDERGSLIGIVSLADLAREAEKQNASASQDITETEIGDTLAAICEPGQRRSGGAEARA